MSGRLIESQNTDPYYVTAVDDAIAKVRKKDKRSDILHFYIRNPSAVSIGRSRKINDDIDIDECLKNNVKIIRRTSGGGSIFTDKGCLIYSLVFNYHKKDLSKSEEIFDVVCNCIVRSFKKIDIITEYKFPNDILLNKKKISGSALIFKKDIALIHGTILFDTDLKLMQKVLKKKIKKDVSTIYNETNNTLYVNEFKEMLKKEFELSFDTVFYKSNLTDEELKLVNELLEKRYCNDDWNFRR